MYKLITCIVEEGKAVGIIEEALKRGAQGATYYNARGKGVREHLGALGMFIKEEKDVILIVTTEEKIDDIFTTIVAMGSLRERGKGFAYVQDVERAVGFLME